MERLCDDRCPHSAAADQRYRALGIARQNKEAGHKAVAANWACLGAPTALFCSIHRDMGPAQWADLRMYLQTIMLLLRDEGLHSCPRMAWSVYRRTGAEIVSPPDDLILFCGLSIGFEDATANTSRIDRAPLAETVTFVDGQVLADHVAGRHRQ